MTSRAAALVPELQRCIDSNRELAEQLYVLVQTGVEHVSLQDHRKMLKHCRFILDYLFSVISNAGQNLPQHDIEQFSQMLGSCKIDQDLVSERLLQIEKLPAFAAILSAIPKDKRSWVSIDQQKSYFLNHWLKEAPIVFSSRDEEGIHKPTEQGQQLHKAAEREGRPPDAPKGSKIVDPTRQTAASGICKPPVTASQAADLAQHVLPHRATSTPLPVFPKSSACLPLLGNQIQQRKPGSSEVPRVDSNQSTRSNSIIGISARHGEIPQSAAIASPDTAQSTSSHGTKRKRRRVRSGKGSSTGESVSHGETPKSAAIALPDTRQSTAPPKKKRRQRRPGVARLRRRLEAVKTMPKVTNQDITTDVNKRPVSEEIDDSGNSRPVKRGRMDDLTGSQQEQSPIQEPASQDPGLSSPLRRYEGKKHLTQVELASLKAYTLGLLRDLQAEAGGVAPVNVSISEAKPPLRRSKAKDFF